MLDYHMHVENYYPFGRTPDTRPTGTAPMDTLRRFIDSAEARGVHEIAITEHVYHFVQAREIVANAWADEKCFYDMDTYVRILQEGQKAGLPIKVGIEMDYMDGKEDVIERIVNDYPWDFVLGSVHWIGPWGFDLSEHRAEWDRRSVDEAYRAYFRLLMQAVDMGCFSSMSHPDLIKVMGHFPLGDVSDLYEAFADRVAAQPGLCVEISSAGIRKPVGRLYPELPLLEACAARGIAITTASDAHAVEDIGRDFDQVKTLAASCGYTHAMSFTRRVATPVPLSR
ncbi:MAG: histidinol-phosphatase HisJ family protein [candidate division Zixibacteria bacterium]|nr:histidinol-phosphatase HisJ family protein [candidate division Zixibacteria bacterium]